MQQYKSDEKRRNFSFPQENLSSSHRQGKVTCPILHGPGFKVFVCLFLLFCIIHSPEKLANRKKINRNFGLLYYALIGFSKTVVALVHVFALHSDWFIAVFVSVVIGQSDYFAWSVSENHSNFTNKMKGRVIGLSMT